MMNLVIRAEKKMVVRSLLGVVILTAAYSSLQIPFGPIATFGAQNAQNEPDQPSIRVKVELVNAPVVVRDAKGEYVLDLSLKNFRVFDNGVKQKLESFEVNLLCYDTTIM
jgi:hypothetical protein